MIIVCIPLSSLLPLPLLVPVLVPSPVTVTLSAAWSGMLLTIADMHILAVRRSHHRRGLGGRLLAVGLAMADEAGRKTFIEASRAGIELYKRYGWELVGEVKVDLESHGFPGLGVYTEGCLMRQPKGKGKEESGREARAIANAVGEKVMG